MPRRKQMIQSSNNYKIKVRNPKQFYEDFEDYKVAKKSKEKRKELAKNRKEKEKEYDYYY